MGILSLFLGPVVKLVNGFLSRKHEMTMAKHTAKVEWAKTMASASATSWKDEYVLILWTAPLALAILGFHEPLDRFIQYLTVLPPWYTYLLVTMSLATFGIGMTDKVTGLLGKRELVKKVLNGGLKKPHIENDPDNPQVEDE